MKEAILQYLKNGNGHISGEELSRRLSISRAAVWKNINELRRMGYRIEAVPHLGYRLTGSPDRLFPWEIRCGLPTKLIGKEVVYLESVTSTMDEASKLGMNGALEGTVVCAETQTRGRGRLGRSWQSPKSKGIYLSVILRPQLPVSEAPKLTLVAAVAVCEAINRVTSLNTRIKWPNDILVGKRKLAGILTEMHAEMDCVKWLIIGIGINVNTPESGLPSEGTSLRIETGKVWQRVDLLKQVLISLDEWYLRLIKEGGDPALKRWKELSVTLGSRVRVSDVRGTVEGKAVDLASDGGLMILCDDGKMVKRISGDVMLVGSS